METNQPNTSNYSEPKDKFSDEVKNFYTKDLKEICITVLTKPINGTFNIFKNPPNNAYQQSIILFLSIFGLYLVGTYLITPEPMRKVMEFKYVVKSSLIPVVFMLMISVVSFVLKSISGKPDLKGELLTGGLAGIPFGILFLIILMLKMFGEKNMENLVTTLDPQSAGLIGGLFLLYFMLMIINIVQQSFLASRSNDAFAWYMSPITILASTYLTVQIAKAFFS